MDEYDQIKIKIIELEEVIKESDKFKLGINQFVKDKKIALNELNNNRIKLTKTIAKLSREEELLQLKLKEWENRQTRIKEDLINLYKEIPQGYPTLAEAYREYLDMVLWTKYENLVYKDKPAIKASETVKEVRQKLSRITKEFKQLSYIVKYYESLYPELTEVRGDDINIDELIENTVEDPAKKYLSNEEYIKLTTKEKYQLALERWWEKSKDKAGIGKLYEQYVGYRLEQEGYNVEYFGIRKRLEDLGRDLIAQKDGRTLIIQCKFWSKSKTIHEKHIFQLYGTSVLYSIENVSKQMDLLSEGQSEEFIQPIFYTSTKLSEKAKVFAEKLNIKIIEEDIIARFPIIKCNLNHTTGEKIYHLPFDQQYYNTNISIKKGEYMVSTIKEAEDLGFRRAYKWNPRN